MLQFLTISLVATLQQPIDGTALNFIVEKDSITVQVGHWRIKSNKAEAMNRFVDSHIKEIDPNKITIYGDGQEKYSSFGSVIQVLKKHDWMKFKLIDTGAKSKPVEKKVDTQST